MNNSVLGSEINRFKFLMEHKSGSIVDENTKNHFKSKNIFLENNKFELPILEEGYNYNTEFIEEGYNFDTVFLEEGYNLDDENLLYEKQIRYYLQKIDDELSKLERLHLTQLVGESKFLYKLQLVESIKNGYNGLFKRYKNEEVLLEYKKNFGGKLILESTYNATEEVSKYYAFLKKSLLYEFDLITRNEYDMILNEEGWGLLGDVGNWVADKASAVGSAVVQGAKNLGNKVVSGAKAAGNWVVDKAQKVSKAYKEGGGGISGVLNVAKKTGKYAVNKVADAWNYIKTKGLDWVMEGIRSFLSSTFGAVAQQILDYTGIGAIGVSVVWAIMTIWDFFKLNSGGSWFKLIFSVLGLLTAGALGKLVGGWLKPMFSKGGGSLDTVLNWFKSQKWFTKYIQPWVSKLASAVTKVGGWIKKAVTWFIEKFPGAKWVQSVGTKLIGWLEGLGTKFAAWAGAGAKAGSQAGTKFVQKQAGQKLVKTAVTDPLTDYGKGLVAQGAGVVGGENVQKAVEVGQELKGFHGDATKLQGNISKAQSGRITPLSSLSKDIAKDTGKVVKGVVKGAEAITPTTPTTNAVAQVPTQGVVQGANVATKTAK